VASCVCVCVCVCRWDRAKTKGPRMKWSITRAVITDSSGVKLQCCNVPYEVTRKMSQTMQPSTLSCYGNMTLLPVTYRCGAHLFSANPWILTPGTCP